MTESKNIWVFIEQEEGHIADVGLELLAKGQELADILGSQVWGLLCGHQIEELADSVIHHGADHVFVVDHPELALYRTLPYARVAIDLIQQHHPYIFLIGATPAGRDLAPRIASAVDVGLTADCTDLQIGDYTSKKEKQEYKDLLYQIRPAFGGNIIATIVNPKTRPQMATVRPGVMMAHQPDTSRKGKIENVKPKFESSDFSLEVLIREMREGGFPPET